MNLIQATLNAVKEGISDDAVLKQVDDYIKTNNVSAGTLKVAPEALREYAKNISDSLNYIASKIEEKSIDDIKEEEKENHKASIKVTEADWENSAYNEKANKLAGTLVIDFGQDMSLYRRDDKVALKQSSLNVLNDAIFNYFRTEYPNLKAELSTSILKGNMVFSNLEKGIGKIAFEIENAF